MPAPAAWLQGAECPCCGRSKLLPSSQTHFSVEQPPDLAVGAAMPLSITLRAAMPLVITTLRVVPLGACRPALSKGSSSTPGSTSGLPQPHSCGSTLSRIWPEKSIFTRNLSLVLKHLQLPGPAPAPRPRAPPRPPALGHPGAAFPSWGTSSCREHYQLLVLNRPLNPHQQYLPPLIKDGSNKHEIWTKMDFNKYCLGELAYP